MRPTLLLFITILGLSACEEETGCTEFGAENYNPDAVINDDSCIKTRDKFLGDFQVSSNCLPDDYSRSITSTTDEYLVILNHFSDTLGSVNAKVFGTNITIEPQTVQLLVKVEGAGVFDEENNGISFTYRIRDSRTGTEVIHDCTEWCSKQ